MGTAGEIVIWMVLAALVGFATGWALRSVVANRARARAAATVSRRSGARPRTCARSCGTCVATTTT